jgi:Ca2+-binding EF-hand superfamily protein
MMFPMIIAMMDSDGDGALSLEEFQAVHARIFKVFDANSDGKVMVDELRNAFQGAPSPAQ